MSIAEKLATVAENVPKVYEAGQKSEYDRFWDIYQDYGNRTLYRTGFAFNGWNDETFCPKYNISGNVNYLFRYAKISDLENLLNKCGVTLDTSSSPALDFMFSESSVTVVPEIDVRNAVSGQTKNALTSTFYAAYYCKTIRKFIIDENIAFVRTFGLMYALENIEIEGTIGQSGFDVHWSAKLTAASLLSILTALSKDSELAEGKSITFATEHQEVIERDEECLEQLNLAINAGWTVAYA